MIEGTAEPTSTPAAVAPAVAPCPSAAGVASRRVWTRTWTARASTALRFTLAKRFVTAGVLTLLAVPAVQDQFETIEHVTGAGAWFRVAAGLLAALGGVLLGVRRSAVVGTVLLAVVMTGAAAVDLRVLRAAPTVPAVLLAALATVGYVHRSDVRAVGTFLGRNR